MRSSVVICAAVLAVAIAAPAPAPLASKLTKFITQPGPLGWSADGHYITAAIATAYLSSTAAEAISTILSPETVESVATWADQVKDDPGYAWSKPLHFINTPSWECAFVAANDCPTDTCVYGSILNYTSQLTSSGTEQYDALKFLIHFVGDIHQPLHCGFKADAGGNDEKGTFLGASTDLHMVWDNLIIQQRLSDLSYTYDQYAAYLVTQLKGPWQSKIATWTTCVTPNDKSCVEAWGSESAGLACTYAYTDSTGNHIADGFDLGLPYYNFALPTVEEQLSKGGIRLAYLLNGVFGS